MRFKGLDLNLLVALDILIEERSVSRAAQRLNMSQPAMSAALGRLRHYFNDPILGAHGKKMVPTAHALLLRPMLQALLADIDAMVSVSTLFDPATSERRFRIGTSDYLATILFAPLIPHLRRSAPGISIDLIPPSDEATSMLDQGVLDLIAMPEETILPDHPAELLFVERIVVAGWTENPLFQGSMTEEDFFAAGHVAVEIGQLRPISFAETHLRDRSRDRRIDVRVSSFLLAPEMLVNTDRLAVMHERLARTFAGRIPIAYRELPFPFPKMREMMQFNRTRQGDAGLRWLMDQMKAEMDHL